MNEPDVAVGVLDDAVLGGADGDGDAVREGDAVGVVDGLGFGAAVAVTVGFGAAVAVTVGFGVADCVGVGATAIGFVVGRGVGAVAGLVVDGTDAEVDVRVCAVDGVDDATGALTVSM